jgi:hypothetical protein
MIPEGTRSTALAKSLTLISGRFGIPTQFIMSFGCSSCARAERSISSMLFVLRRFARSGAATITISSALTSMRLAHAVQICGISKMTQGVLARKISISESKVEVPCDREADVMCDRGCANPALGTGYGDDLADGLCSRARVKMRDYPDRHRRYGFGLRYSGARLQSRSAAGHRRSYIRAGPDRRKFRRPAFNVMRRKAEHSSCTRDARPEV